MEDDENLDNNNYNENDNYNSDSTDDSPSLSEDDSNPINNEEDDDEPQFEMSPDDATSLDESKPLNLNRKKILVVICISFSVVVLVAMCSSQTKSSKKNNIVIEDEAVREANDREYFLAQMHNEAMRNAANRQRQEAIEEELRKAEEEDREPDFTEINETLPEVTFTRNTPEPPQQNQNQEPAYQRPPQQSSGGGGGGGSSSNPNLSSIVPNVQGNLLATSTTSTTQAQPSPSPAAAPPQLTPAAMLPNSTTNYQAQNNQTNKTDFYNPSTGGTILGGNYISDYSIWVGTTISGILETAVNTNLPGNVRARVTQNVFDSRTGQVLLIPQGSILLARYNSSISPGQNRVQIIWDTLIRPDGYEIELSGAPGVDREGMSGQAAIFSENWFEYAKATGIITMFSMATSSLANTAAKYGGDSAGNAAANSSSQVLNQLGSNLIERAMNIQPTLTIENGTTINVFLNKTLFLPPIEAPPVTQNYVLPRR